MRIKIFIFTVFFLIWGTSFGMEIPTYDGYINDKIGLLNQQERTDLENLVRDIETKTSAEIAVLLVDTIGGDDINLVANEVGNKRGVGKKDKDNGVIILVALDDRRWSIQVGYGLEGVIPDLIAKRIGEEEMTPNFQKGDYYLGIKHTIDNIYSYISGEKEYKENSTTRSHLNDISGKSILQKQNILIVVVVIFLSISFATGMKNFVYKERGKKRVTKTGWIILFSMGLFFSLLLSLFLFNGLWSIILIFGGTYSVLLLGLLIAMYGESIILKSNWRNFPGKSGGFGGGSFGGFGGGSFGGGGSSGKW